MKPSSSPTIPGLALCGLALLLGLWVWHARTDDSSDVPAVPESRTSSTAGSLSILPSQSLKLPAAPKVPATKAVTEPSLGSESGEITGRPALAPELKKDEQASLWKALSEARREVSSLTEHEAAMPINEGVRLFAQSPSQNLTARFLDQSVRIESGHIGKDWQATFSLPGLPEATELAHVGTRVEYRRGPVIEWFDNRPEGIEQGFIVTRPLQAAGDLRIDVTVEGLRVARSDEDQSAFVLSDASQVARLSYSKLIAWDATGKELSARMEPAADGIALIVADAGAAYPVTIDPLITSLEQKLGPAIETGGSGAEGDYFGFSVALSGDTALIGSYKDDTATTTDAGSAYVFIRSGTNWSMQAKLTDAGFLSYNRFGFSVALAGDTALIGASGYISDSVQGYPQRGSAYVFVRSGTTWSQQAKLTASDGISGDQFGYSVALSGNTAIIGASYDDTAAGTNTGSAYVFIRSGTTWAQQAMLTASDAFIGLRFGISVAVAGETALVGADAGSGAAYVFIRSGTTWAQQAKLTASDAANGDNFGWSVALFGETALIGAFSDNGGKGSAYAFVRSGTTWSQQAKLIALDVSSAAGFGYSVALSGDTALVGVFNDNTAAGASAGSAYVFVRSGSSWSQQAKLTATDAAAYDYFGRSVALSGNTALVGADLSNTDAGDAAGSAYVFVRSGTTWSQQAKLKTADAAADDWFGYSVALFGDTALIGAYKDDTVSVNNGGSAYVFVRSGTTWSQQAKLNASDAASSDQFGISVAVDGDTALVGADLDETSTGSYTGSAYVFVRAGTTWSQQAKLTAADRASIDFFGTSVSLSGNTAIVGASYDDTAAGTNTGSAYIFVRSGTTWSQQANLTAADGAPNDYFGRSVSLSGDTALVGAYSADTAAGTNVGSAYVYVRAGSSWSQQAKLNAADAAANDNFAYSVALSGDTAIVGALFDDTSAGIDAGSAYVFVRTGNIWTEQAKLTAADGAATDYFGNSVALSGDTALVGAYCDDTTSGTNAGSSYVYLRTGTVWSQEAKLTAADGAYNDYFGHSIALSGDTALVGAYADDGFDSIGQSVADQGSVYVFRLGDSSAPEIAIEQAGTNIASGATKGYGPVVAGTTSDLIFTILNPGTGDLTLTGTPKVAVSGSSDFTVTAQPASTINGPSGSSNFTVRFTPTGSGLKSASLSIPNNDGDETPFVINLTGTATTASDLFTSTIASSSGLTGDDALPTAIPFNDGVENVLKYAFNMNLAGPDTRSLPPGAGTAGLPAVGLTGSGASTMMRVEYLRRKGSGLVYTPKRSSNLAPGSFVAMGGTPVVTSIDANWERVVVEESANPAILPKSFAIVEVTIPQ